MGISGSAQGKHRAHASVLNRKNRIFHVEHGRAGFHLNRIGSILQRAGRGLSSFLFHSGKRCSGIDRRLHMLHIKLLDRRDLSQALQNTFHLIAFVFQHCLPGVLFLSCHIVVRMVSGDHHQRLKNHLCVGPFLLQRRDHIVQRGLRLHRPDVIILISGCRKLLLKGCVNRVGIRFRAMAHEADRRFPVVMGRRMLRDRRNHRVIIRVGHKKRRSEKDPVKPVHITGKLLCQVRIFIAVHQMGGLDDKLPDSICLRPVKRFGHIIDRKPVPFLQLVDDDLARERPADLIFRESAGNRLFNRPDRQIPAVIVAGSKAHNQNRGIRLRFLRLCFRLCLCLRFHRGLLLGDAFCLSGFHSGRRRLFRARSAAAAKTEYACQCGQYCNQFLFHFCYLHSGIPGRPHLNGRHPLLFRLNM